MGDGWWNGVVGSSGVVREQFVGVLQSLAVLQRRAVVVVCAGVVFVVDIVVFSVADIFVVGWGGCMRREGVVEGASGTLGGKMEGVKMVEVIEVVKVAK